jgi:hypothetical protein
MQPANSGGGDSAAIPTPTSTAINAKESSANAADIADFGGHVFSKKTFGKPTYCHHCCDKIWGMLSLGYVCEGASLLLAIPSILLV